MGCNQSTTATTAGRGGSGPAPLASFTKNPLVGKNPVVVSSVNGDSDSDSDSDSDGELVSDWLVSGPSVEELQQQEEFSRQQRREVQRARTLSAGKKKWSKFFEQFPREHQAELYQALKYKSFRDGDPIVNQGEKGSTFYVITEGKAAVTVRDEASEHGVREITHLYVGDSFGETSLIYGSDRTATVSSIGKCTCGILYKEDFDRMTDVRNFLIMKSCDLIQQLSQDEQVAVLSYLQPREFKAGEHLIEEGRVVQASEDAFFMITKGEIQVYDKAHGNLVALYAGHSVGEMALINDAPRNASVKAKSNVVTCLALKKRDFVRVCTGSGEFQTKVENITKRLEQVRTSRKKRKDRSIKRKLSIANGSLRRLPKPSPPAPSSRVGGLIGRHSSLMTAEDVEALNSIAAVAPDAVHHRGSAMSPFSLKAKGRNRFSNLTPSTVGGDGRPAAAPRSELLPPAHRWGPGGG